MTASDKLEANDRREEQFVAAGGMCVVCSAWLLRGHAQLAHRLINSDHNRETIPEDVLHHPLSTIPVDRSDSCNSAVILHGPEAAALRARIERVLSGEESVDLQTYYSDLREEFYRKRNKVYR